MAQVSWFSEAESKHFFLMQVCEEIAVQIRANSAIDTLACLMVVSIFGTRIPMVYHGLSWFIMVYHHVSTFKLPFWYPPSDFETNLAACCMLLRLWPKLQGYQKASHPGDTISLRFGAPWSTHQGIGRFGRLSRSSISSISSIGPFAMRPL
jgi:hypothetical protein